jgi:hypothetical protein
MREAQQIRQGRATARSACERSCWPAQPRCWCVVPCGYSKLRKCKAIELATDQARERRLILAGPTKQAMLHKLRQQAVWQNQEVR